MNYRTEMTVPCSQTVLEGNPLLLLFDKTEEQQKEPGRRIYCQSAVTTEKEKIEVNAQHAFQMTNPSGIDFNVTRFRSAWGCCITDEKADER